MVHYCGTETKPTIWLPASASASGSASDSECVVQCDVHSCGAHCARFSLTAPKPRARWPGRAPEAQAASHTIVGQCQCQC